MKTNRLRLILLIVVILTFGSASWTNATICDDDPDAVLYKPTVEDASLLNGLLNLLGQVELVDFSMSDVPFSQKFDHFMNVTMNSTINMSGVNFFVIPDVGSIEVLMHLPPWDAEMYITVEHANCRNCMSEWYHCTTPCEPRLDSCLAGCGVNDQFCVDVCWAARNVCYAGCNAAKVGCDLNAGACNMEANILDSFINEHTMGMSYDNSTISQTADVCVTGTCKAVHPHVSTDIDLHNFHVRYFPETDSLGFGLWLNNKVTGMVNNMVSINDTIKSILVDEETGKAMMINSYSNEIKNDGCSPVQEVQNCRGGGSCSITTTQDISARQNAGILLYSLPILIMGGLILWRRRR